MSITKAQLATLERARALVAQAKAALERAEVLFLSLDVSPNAAEMRKRGNKAGELAEGAQGILTETAATAVGWLRHVNAQR